MNIKQYIYGLILEELELFKYEQLKRRVMLYEAAVIPPNQNNQQPVQPQGNSTSVQQPQQTQPQPNQPQQQPPQQQPPQQNQQQSIPKITKADAVAKIRASKGRIFTCIFIKRTDGTKRAINCRLGVKRYLRGGTLNYVPSQHGLIPVYDVKIGGSGAYRMINIDGIIALKIGQAYYEVT